MYRLWFEPGMVYVQYYVSSQDSWTGNFEGGQGVEGAYFTYMDHCGMYLLLHMWHITRLHFIE